MQIHFHLGRLPVMISLTKGDNQARELQEKTDALVELAMMLPTEGARARYIMRRWAGARR